MEAVDNLNCAGKMTRIGWKSFILVFLVEIHNVFIVFFIGLVFDFLQLLKAFSYCHLLLLLLLELPLLSFFLEVTSEHFFKSLTGFSFQLILLFDCAFQTSEIVEVIRKSKLLSEKRDTLSADSRCSPLMVFLLFDSHMLLALSESLVMNSKYWKSITF